MRLQGYPSSLEKKRKISTCIVRATQTFRCYVFLFAAHSSYNVVGGRRSVLVME